jgi:antitoxin VapB
MRLDIKDPEAHKLAKQLARESGETITAAVITALRGKLEQVRREKKRKRRPRNST